MATYYKYAEREKTNQIDWNKISSDINKSMAAIEEAKAARRAADQKALNDSFQRLRDKPIGEDYAENERIANFTQQAEEIMLRDLRALKRGDISRREYNLKYNAIKQGTEDAFSLSKQYQDAYQMHVDRIEAGEASGGEAKLLAKAEQYGLAKDSQYYIDPITNSVSIALTTGEGIEGDVKIGDSQFDLMGMRTARNMIFQKIDKYKTQDQVAKLTENLKTEALDVLDGVAPDGTSLKGYISTEKGFDVQALFDVVEGELVPKKGNEDAANALLAQINATFAGKPFAKYSFLEDTLGTINGKTVEFVFANKDETPEQFLNRKTEDHEVKMILDKQDRYVPQITESQNKIIERNMVALIKNSIDTSFGIKADTRLTDKQRFDIGQVNRGLQEKKDSLRLSLDTMSQLYRGGAVDLEVATTYFKGIDPGVRKVERNDNGLILTIEDDDGNVKRETVSFFAQDESGKILEDKPLSERQFIQAASNLLLGTDKTETKEFRQLWNRRDKDGNFVYGGETRSIGSAEVGEGVTPGRGKLDTTEIDSYLQGKFSGEKSDSGVSKGIDFRDEDYEVAKQIIDTFADGRVPIRTKAVGTSQTVDAQGNKQMGSGFADLVEIRIDGYNQAPLVIPADYNRESDARQAENKVREYIKAYLVRGGGGVGAQYN